MQVRLETSDVILGHYVSFLYNWESLGDGVAMFSSTASMQSRKIIVKEDSAAMETFSEVDGTIQRQGNGGSEYNCIWLVYTRLGHGDSALSVWSTAMYKTDLGFNVRPVAFTNECATIARLSGVPKQ